MLRQLDDKTLVSGQIAPGDVPKLRDQGVTMIVNHRPDCEEPGQPLGADIKAAAEQAGIAYRHDPIARDALRADAYGGLSFGPGAKPILKGEEQLVIAVPPPRKRKGRRDRATGPADPLFDALREARRALAAEAGVPPYVIFHDSTLRGIAAAKPVTLAELSRIQGVGEAKLLRYGDAMLAAVAAHEEASHDAPA